MRYFDDNEIILQKALAMRIVDSLQAAQGKVQKMAEKIAASINLSEMNFSETKEIQKLALYANEMKDKQDALVKALAVANRIENLIARNMVRIEYFSNYLKSVGIYNEKFDIKDLEAMEKAENANITDDLLNLNLYAEGGKVYRYVFDDVFVFENGSLNLSDPVNENCLSNITEANMQKMIHNYPESVSTLSGKMMKNVSFKKKLLKCIAAYVMENVKVKSIKDINKAFGNLLSFKIKAIYSAYEYILAVQNLFNVKIKNEMLIMNHENTEEVYKKLPCDESSVFIPADVDITVLRIAADDEKRRVEDAKAKKDRAMQVIAERFAVCYRVKRKKLKV